MGSVPAKAAPDPLKGLIRLQVVASSDSMADQRYKLTVRDRVRAAAVKIVSDARNSDEAFARLRKYRLSLERAAGARVEIREVDCPLRVYGRLVVPAGRYRVVRVILGAGSGRNWWCVLYPDLCATNPLEVKALEGDEPVVFYSEVMRWVEAMRGNGS
jgi:stage II sporulation protein R